MTKYLVALILVFMCRFTYCQSDISVNIGISYSDYNIRNNPNNLFKEINDDKMESTANLMISNFSGNFLHSLQLGVINFTRSYYLEDKKFGYGHGNAYSFWKVGYNFGKRWHIDSKHRFSLSSTIGVHMIIKQKNLNLDFLGTYIEYPIDTNVITVTNESVPKFKEEFAIVNSTYFKIRLYKNLNMNIGCDFHLWFHPVFIDSKYSILENSRYIGVLEIRSFKPIVLAYLGLSYNFLN